MVGYVIRLFSGGSLIRKYSTGAVLRAGNLVSARLVSEICPVVQF